MRTRDQIVASGSYEREKFKSAGVQTRDRESEKDRLARQLAGIEPDKLLADEKRPTTLAEFEAQQLRLAQMKKQMKAEEASKKEKDRFDEC